MNKTLQNLIFLVLAMGAVNVQAQSVCARVTIEITQDVALARQAFEARMRIANGFASDLQDVHVTLHFLDANGAAVVGVTNAAENLDAAFFYRAEVAAGSTAEIPHPTAVGHGDGVSLVWTIIPALSAAKTADGATGTKYQIGAELAYTLNMVPYIQQIEPKAITVRPAPVIQLDYFLQKNVSGDDPFTDVKELPVPFPLGLRARNIGRGIAQRLTVVSSTPVIVGNLQSAAAEFSINSLKVNDQPSSSSGPELKADISSLLPGAAAMVRWGMWSALSGRFTSFQAQVSHSDEQGGALTSLIGPVNAYMLEGEVIVNGVGQDGVVDFLAWKPREAPLNGTDLYVFESRPLIPSIPGDTGDTKIPVSNWSDTVSVVDGVISLPPGNVIDHSTFSYVSAEVSAAYGKNRRISRVTRLSSDGKVLPAQNAWISSRYDPPAQSGGLPLTHYVVHVFDQLSDLPVGAPNGVSWRIETAPVLPDPSNHAPVFKPLPNRIVKQGEPLSFPVQATDPDTGDSVTLRLITTPYGSHFTSAGGSGTFSWTPGTGGILQTGDTTLNFSATDTKTTSFASMVVTVTNGSTLEGWKKHWWPDGGADSLNSADPDGDGLTNLYEYALDLDPTKSSTHQRPVLSREIDGGSESDHKPHLVLTATYRSDDPTLTVKMLAAGDPSFPEGESLAEDVKLHEVAGVPTADQGDTPPGFVRARFRDPLGLDDSHKRFVRLRVTQTLSP